MSFSSSSCTTSDATIPRRCGAGARRSTHDANDVNGLGLDEDFQRLWTFYLCYCEAGFIEGRVSDVQVLLRPSRS